MAHVPRLHAAVSSLTDSDLRDEVQALLAQSEERFVARLSARYAVLTELLGFQVRKELDLTLEDLALLASSTLRGLVLSALARPELTNPRHARPTGASSTKEWTLSGLALLGLVDTFLVYDTQDWPPERAAMVERSLTEVLSAL